MCVYICELRNHIFIFQNFLYPHILHVAAYYVPGFLAHMGTIHIPIPFVFNGGIGSPIRHGKGKCIWQPWRKRQAPLKREIATGN
jgi:hypothetical protein